MTDRTNGLVLYADGSFRNGHAGWGFHGYFYETTPLTRGIGVKQLPTLTGYQKVPLEETVTPLNYVDGFGHVEGKATNNTGELQAVIEALTWAYTQEVPRLLIYVDSEYVRKGLTRYLAKWIKSDWVKADGQPVANREFWEQLDTLDKQWKASGREYRLEWIKGHSNDLGNDYADTNARNGSGGNPVHRITTLPVDNYHNPKTDAHPLTLKTRMIFSMGGESHITDDGAYYYQYQLGRSATYGQKQGDTTKDRHNKTDLVFGRRIGDATFAVLRLPEVDPYLETLMAMHKQCHQQDIVELGVVRLDNAYRPGIYQRIQHHGADGLIPQADNYSLITPHDDLISITQNPPKMAMDGVKVLMRMQDMLDQFLAGDLGKGVRQFDVTDRFFAQETTGKKVQKTVTKLHKEITSATPFVEAPVTIRDMPVTLKLILGVDIPPRNTFAKLAELSPKVTVLVVMDGPTAYSYATVVQTSQGSAIYQSPYTHFVLPLDKKAT